MDSQIQNRINGSRLSSVERAAHREWIGGAMSTLLSHFWREDDPVELTAALGKDWADVLEGLPQEAIEKARLNYLKYETKKPTPAAIYRMAQKFVPPPRVVRKSVSMPEPPVTREQAQSILEDVGFRPKTFGKKND